MTLQTWRVPNSPGFLTWHRSTAATVVSTGCSCGTTASTAIDHCQRVGRRRERRVFTSGCRARSPAREPVTSALAMLCHVRGSLCYAFVYIDGIRWEV